VPGLPIVVDRDDGEDPRCRQLLAVHELRGSVECRAVAQTAAWWTRLAVMPGNGAAPLLPLKTETTR